MDKRRLAVILIALLAVAAGCYWYFSSRNGHNGQSASGTIEATEVVVSSKVSGTITDLKFQEGDRVKTGDTLALIEQDTYQANYDSALARNDLAQADLKRNKQLFEQNMISSQQYQAAQSAADVADSALKLARRSPISGTVLVKAIEIGELASPGSPVCTLADLDSVNLMVYLPEDKVGQASLGQEVKVTVDSYPNVDFKGKVTYISSQAEFTPKSIQTKDERVTQVFGVKIVINNQDGKLKPGMPADAHFQWN